MSISRGNIGRYFERRTRGIVSGAVDADAWCFDLAAPGEIIEVKSTYREVWRLDVTQMDAAIEEAEERAVTYALWHYRYNYRREGSILKRYTDSVSLARGLARRTEAVWFLPIEFILDLVACQLIDARYETGHWGRSFLVSYQMLLRSRHWKTFCAGNGIPDEIAKAWRTVYRTRKGIRHPIITMRPTPRP